jgi:hypothetical protein
MSVEGVDVVMRFDLRAEDWRLIAAAIALGDWLAARVETTPAQRKAIRRVQGALRRLPDDSPDLVNADYGFCVIPAEGLSEAQELAISREVRNGDHSRLRVYRSWTVSLSRPAPGAPGELSVFNTYTTYPLSTRPEWEDAEHEFRFRLEAGETNPWRDDAERRDGQWGELIEELTHPLAYMTAAHSFEIQECAEP